MKKILLGSLLGSLGVIAGIIVFAVWLAFFRTPALDH